MAGADPTAGEAARRDTWRAARGGAASRTRWEEGDGRESAAATPQRHPREAPPHARWIKGGADIDETVKGGFLLVKFDYEEARRHVNNSSRARDTVDVSTTSLTLTPGPRKQASTTNLEV